VPRKREVQIITGETVNGFVIDDDTIVHENGRSLISVHCVKAEHEVSVELHDLKYGLAKCTECQRSVLPKNFRRSQR
jgi:hypothetical protein